SHESQLLNELRMRQDQLAKALEQQVSEKERESAQQELAKLKKDWELARARYREMLEKAKKPFEAVEDALCKREQDEKMSDADRALMRQAAFAAAESYFFLEDYPEAVRRYNILCIRYAGQFEEVVAWSQLYQCAIYAKDLDKAKVCVDKVRGLAEKLP